MSLKTWYNNHKQSLKTTTLSIGGGVIGGAGFVFGLLFLLGRNWI